jgi:cell division protein FtsN
LGRFNDWREGREAASFWLITLVLCLVAGLVSYGLGRNWVGRQLGEAITSQRVEIKQQEQANALGNSVTEGAPPPSQAQVDMTPRPATEGEKADLTAESAAAAAGAAAEQPAASGADATAGTTGWQVTAGSFTTAASAEKVRRSLEKRGFQAQVVQVQQRGATYNRVIVGVWSDQAEAEKVRAELSAAGFVAGVSAQ